MKIGENSQSARLWPRMRYVFGYGLFAFAVGYGLRRTPEELWDLQAPWLLATALVAALMFLLQYLQVLVFLSAHGVGYEHRHPALFTARKGILNCMLPAKTGTLVLLHMLTDEYGLRWRDFVVFVLVASALSVCVSILAAVWLVLPAAYFRVLALASCAVLYGAARLRLFPYAPVAWRLGFIAIGLYAGTVAGMYCVLQGLGFSLTLVQVTHFAVVLNVLAQVSVTPGNAGVRELVVGAIAPYVALPMSVGMLASAVVYVVRLAVYALILAALEWRGAQRRAPSARASADQPDSERR